MTNCGTQAKAKSWVAHGKCEVCKDVKDILHLEWRVDWFQGNCEFKDICKECFKARQNKIVAEAAVEYKEYVKKMRPIWKKWKKREEEMEETGERTDG